MADQARHIYRRLLAYSRPYLWRIIFSIVASILVAITDVSFAQLVQPLVDDVITAGTAIREAIGIIRASGGEPCGVVLALDRQERGQGERSAVQEVEVELGLPVTSIITLADLVADLERREHAGNGHLAALRAYRERYGVG